MNFTGGGCLPVTGPAGELGDFGFTAMAPSAVSAASLASFDTAVLNVASVAMACNTNTLTAQQQADLVSFVASGKKLIIYDSECFPVDYSWMPFPFTTSNPGAQGAQGTLVVVEDNLLSTKVGDPNCLSGDPHCINTADLSTNTDAVGDMNVMSTFDANWCVDMAGTNAISITGPAHTYAKYPAGTDVGLFIYNGLDQDYQYSYLNNPNLRKIWVQELQQPFNPSSLPCGITVVGITLSPASATNDVGQSHTVTATLTDLLGNPQTGILVTFTVTSGPNTGVSGTGTTDASGHATFTYTSVAAGTDEIEACFLNQAGQELCSQVVTKEWKIPPVLEGRMTGGGSIFTANGTRVTHGFTLRCDITRGPNNLQIDWQGNRFHLDTLTSAVCTDDPAIAPNPPSAGFDTYRGRGTGRYNGVPGATATWTFTDQGEPGKSDRAAITITDANGNVVLNVALTVLDKGNHQAHKK